MEHQPHFDVPCPLIHEDWKDARKLFIQPRAHILDMFTRDEINPPRRWWYRPYHRSYKDVKVVMSDWRVDRKNTDGLAFSQNFMGKQRKGSKVDHLIDAYTSDLGFRQPSSLSLMPWHNNGIFLNHVVPIRSKTVRTDYLFGWEYLYRHTLYFLSDYHKRMAFILTHDKAAKWKDDIRTWGGGRDHLIIIAKPSEFKKERVFSRVADHLRISKETLWRLP